MKRILIIISTAIVTVLTGCLKDKPNVDFASTQGTYIAEISTANTSPTPNAAASGLAFMSAANLSLPASDTVADTVWFTVNIASDYPPTKDIPITLTVDQTALNNYISNPNNVQYQLFPDSTFTIPTLTGTVKAGNMNRLDTFYVLFYPWKVDPASSYMLPLTITQAPGCTISGNLGTIYLHVVGNPLAGPYNDVSATRYNYTNGVASLPAYSYPGPEPTPVSTLDLSPYFPKFASPNSPTEILIPYANNLGNYIIDFDASYNLTVTTDVSGITGFTVFYANYDQSTKTIHLITGYLNATPAARIVDETMVHQ
jgi:hypothetical protein